jgi:hypothetical protein
MIDLARNTKKGFFDGRRTVINPKLILGLGWATSTIIFACIQLQLGTDLIIVCMASISLLCCVIPLFFFGINDICAMFILVLLSKYSLFPLWVKTLFGERIDIGLTSPFDTFAFALVGSVIGCIALFLAKAIPIKRGLVVYRLTNKQMLLTGYIATTCGLLFLTLHIIFTPVLLPGGELISGFGGFGSLVGPLYFGIICITAIGFKSNNNPIHKIFLISVLISLILLSIQTNAKAEFTLALFTFTLTIFYFRIKIKVRYIIYSCLLVAFYGFFFAPVIHLTRTYAFKTAELSGKISIIENMFRDSSILEIAEKSNELFNYNYYPSIHTFVIDRFEMIQDMDIVAGGISSRNIIDWLPIKWAIESALPSFLIRNKPAFSDIDLIAYNAGYFPILIRLNHTIGIFGSAYAMFLWPGLVYISFLILFLYILELRLINLSKLDFNIFGIYFLGRYVINFSEQAVQALLVTMIRSIPIDIFLIIAILFLARRIFPDNNLRLKNLSNL